MYDNSRVIHGRMQIWSLARQDNETRRHCVASSCQLPTQQIHPTKMSSQPNSTIIPLSITHEQQPVRLIELPPAILSLITSETPPTCVRLPPVHCPTHSHTLQPKNQSCAHLHCHHAHRRNRRPCHTLHRRQNLLPPPSPQLQHIIPPVAVDLRWRRGDSYLYRHLIPRTPPRSTRRKIAASTATPAISHQQQ